MNIKVYKVGGAILNKIEGFHQLRNILKDNTDKIILVISALGRTTSKLLLAAHTAVSDDSRAINLINEIISEHKQICQNIIVGDKNIKQILDLISQQSVMILNIIRGISITKELTPRTQDLMLSYGEMLATSIVEMYLSTSEQRVMCCDATKLIITNSVYGNASPDISKAKENVNEILLPMLNTNDIIITQGFIAASYNGEITTMGYESSNLTATILAGLSKADEFVIWTDTEGIRLADPKLLDNIGNNFRNNIVAKRLSYDTAEYIANAGLKLIHPPMIRFLRMFELSVLYKSMIILNGEYSEISAIGDCIDYGFILNKQEAELATITIMNYPIKEYLQLCDDIIDNNSIISSHIDYRNKIMQIEYKVDNNDLQKKAIRFFINKTNAND